MGCECPAQSLEKRHQLGDAGDGAQAQQGEFGIPGNLLGVFWVLKSKKKKLDLLKINVGKDFKDHAAHP